MAPGASLSTAGEQPGVLSAAQKPDHLPQKLPFGVNRIVLLFLYFVIVLLKGCTYWGWNGIQEMLYKSGAYSWKCGVDIDEGNISAIVVGGVRYVNCPARRELIASMYTTALASHLISSAFTGIILDWAGPKVSVILGIAFDAAGWILLAFGSNSIHTFYPAAVFWGLGADPGYLPLLSISKLFPGNESFVISLNGSLRSVSFAVPVIMAAIYSTASYSSWDLKLFCFGYVGVGLGLCLLIAVFFVPMKAFKSQEQLRAEAQGDEPGLQPRVLELKETGTNVNESAAAIPAVKSDFYNSLTSAKFLLILPIFVVALLRSEFYVKSNKEQLVVTSGDNLYTLFSMLNILSFIPGPIFGKLVDKCGICFVLFVLNTCGVLMYSFIMPDNIACKGISLIFFFIYTSFVLSNVYCYISINFPAEYFGKLAGLVSLVGGAFSLTSIGWYALCTTTFASWYPYDFLVVDSIMVVGGLIVYVLVYVIWKMDRKIQAADSPFASGKGSNDVVAV